MRSLALVVATVAALAGCLSPPAEPAAEARTTHAGGEVPCGFEVESVQPNTTRTESDVYDLAHGTRGMPASVTGFAGGGGIAFECGDLWADVRIEWDAQRSYPAEAQGTFDECGATGQGQSSPIVATLDLRYIQPDVFCGFYLQPAPGYTGAYAYADIRWTAEVHSV